MCQDKKAQRLALRLKPCRGGYMFGLTMATAGHGGSPTHHDTLHWLNEHVTLEGIHVPQRHDNPGTHGGVAHLT